MDFSTLDLDNWKPPKNWLKIDTVDAHTAGEPLRIIYKGFPPLKGNTILERRRDAQANYDHIRKALMWEPRGHADMYGCIVTPAVSKSADFGVIFTHNAGYSTMCGHGIIAVVTVLLETGVINTTSQTTEVHIDTPAGLVTAYASIVNGRVEKVRFKNVPAFVYARDLSTEISGLGKIQYDIAFGGAFYAFVDADTLGISLSPDNYQGLKEAGMAIKNKVMAEQNISHPFEEDLNFLYGTIFTGAPHSSAADSRNVCVFADGEVDRSPTGTGVSARMALHLARQDITADGTMRIESIIGTQFRGSIDKEISFGGYEAVIPVVEGSAHITGRQQFVIDPDDPLKEGFILC